MAVPNAFEIECASALSRLWQDSRNNSDDAKRAVDRLIQLLTMDTSGLHDRMSNSMRVLVFEAAESLLAGNPASDRLREALVSLRSAAEPLDLASMLGTDERQWTAPRLTGSSIRGVSLVTCCMNRNDNLMRALRTWVAIDDIDEILIVDWTSKELVSDRIRAERIRDDRIRIVRVDNAPRWILTYAFNIGFRLATYSNILKVDADIVLTPDFFRKNILPNRGFIAGNWRVAEPGQEFVNGFFYASKDDLAKIGGFNEFITTYGWDDDDIYSRLVLSGLARKDVDPATLSHLDHDDVSRTATQYTPGMSAAQAIATSTNYKIRTNRMIAGLMPQWDAGFEPCEFTLSGDSRRMVAHLERTESTAPAGIEEAARNLALREVLAWRFGSGIWDLGDAAFSALTMRDGDTLSSFEVAVAGSPHYGELAARKPFLCLLVENYETLRQPGFEDAARAVFADHPNRSPCLVFNIDPTQVEQHRKAIDRVACHVFYWELADGIEMSELGDETLVRDGRNFMARGDTAIMAKCKSSSLAEPSVPGHVAKVADDHHAAVPSDTPGEFRVDQLVSGRPSSTKQRGTVVIDAQHGLGNRLRAIGSAAALAQATDRHLLIAWERDIHCDASFADLFDYDGPVLDRCAGLREAFEDGSVYDYMSSDPEHGKNEPIRHEGQTDLLVRSAFVLNHPFGGWDNENRFLRQLIPAGPVRQLLAHLPPTHELSMHIRMAASDGTAIEAWDDESNWSKADHDAIVLARNKSHYSRFVDAFRNQFPHVDLHDVFIAADIRETYSKLEQVLGPGFHRIPRQCDDRSSDQLIAALADMYALGRGRCLLASPWSSFSEGVLRLSSITTSVYYAGTDF